MYIATYRFTYDVQKHVIRESTELVKTESPKASTSPTSLTPGVLTY